MLFHFDYDKNTLLPTAIGMIVAFLFLLTPWVRIIKLRQILKQTKLVSQITSYDADSEEGQKTFESYSPDFVFDYDRENPITQSEANK